jgi:hypothetical protein
MLFVLVMLREEDAVALRVLIMSCGAVTVLEKRLAPSRLILSMVFWANRVLENSNTPSPSTNKRGSTMATSIRLWPPDDILNERSLIGPHSSW